MTALAERPRCAGMTLPVHAGVADPAKLHWAIKLTSQLRVGTPAATA